MNSAKPTMSGGRVECPSCASIEVEIFYEVNRIPVHSVLLMETREAAINYPTRDLRLGFCWSCGFIFNTIFDPSVHEYSSSCEETQGFSSTFNRFSRDLADRWVKGNDLVGKDILEIGCGKGEFLAQMVECGAGRGCGVDPAYVPGRLVTPVSDRLEFYQELYGEAHALRLRADAVCCRHTLEHISPVREFLRMVVDSHRESSKTKFLFELPDGRRVLEECAFWDIYYEHCSYFTSGSLARLFRSLGLDIDELQLEYYNQYITICGSMNRIGEGACFSGEDDLGGLRELVSRFRQNVHEAKLHWISRFDSWRVEGKKVALWGGGSKAVSFTTSLGLGRERIESVIDINPNKQGKYLPGSGLLVGAPCEIVNSKIDITVAMNPAYVEEIREAQKRRGRVTEILALQ